MRLYRLAFGPVARSSRDRLTAEAARALEATFAGPLPEAVGRSLAEHRVLERVLAEMVDTYGRDGSDANAVDELLDRILRSPAIDRVIDSDAFKRALTNVAASPELRRAFTQQTTGFGEDLAEAMRRRARMADEAAERRVQRRPPPSAPEQRFAGLASRGVALVVDAAVAQSVFVVAAGSVALVLELAGALSPGGVAGGAAGLGWLLVVSTYFVGFWSSTGQTPGLRLMQLRVVTPLGQPPSVTRSLVRFAGLLLAIIPLGAGFLTVLFDRQRRALQDLLAGTSAVYADRAGSEVAPEAQVPSPLACRRS